MKPRGFPKAGPGCRGPVQNNLYVYAVFVFCLFVRTYSVFFPRGDMIVWAQSRRAFSWRDFRSLSRLGNFARTLQLHELLHELLHDELRGPYDCTNYCTNYCMTICADPTIA